MKASAPGRITQHSADPGVRVEFEWQQAEGATLRVSSDPERDFVLLEWTETLLHDRYAEAMSEYAEMFAEEDLDEESRKQMEEYLAQLRDSPPEQETRVIRFDPWKRRSDGTWLPTRVETSLVEPEPMVPTADADLAGIMERYSQVFQYSQIEWLEVSDLRGRVTPQEAFAPPAGYEGYMGQQWIDLTLPVDPVQRTAEADRLREGLVLVPGEDMEGRGRWVVADADDAALGAWPVQTGDVLLLAGCTCLQPISVEPDEQGRGPIEQVAAALEEADAENPATLRVGRGTEIIDIVGWVPKSQRTEDLMAVQEAILKSHEYSPLPYEKTVAFAEAVLAATDGLVD